MQSNTSAAFMLSPLSYTFHSSLSIATINVSENNHYLLFIYISIVKDNLCLRQDDFGFISFGLKSRAECLNYLKGPKMYTFYIIYGDSANISSIDT